MWVRAQVWAWFERVDEDIGLRVVDRWVRVRMWAGAGARAWRRTLAREL